MESKKEKLSSSVYYETFSDLQGKETKGINLDTHKKLNACIVWIFEEILELKRRKKIKLILGLVFAAIIEAVKNRFKCLLQL